MITKKIVKRCFDYDGGKVIISAENDNPMPEVIINGKHIGDLQFTETICDLQNLKPYQNDKLPYREISSLLEKIKCFL